MTTKFAELMQSPEFQKLYAVEGSVAEAAELIASIMEEKNLSKADLARKLGKTPPYVTQLLSGGTNMTLRTLAEVLFALDSKLKVTAEPDGSAPSMKREHGQILTFKFPASVRPARETTLGYWSVNAGTYQSDCVADSSREYVA
jgi:transcriptional regulator with XRE-family HTH domain